MLSELIGLFYPDICAGCGSHLYKNEIVICSRCNLSLPRTRFHSDSDNLVNRVFRGRLDLEAATSYLFFRKGSRVQKLLHELKYNGKEEVGRYLGRELGHELILAPPYDKIDMVVPVPLHNSRIRTRGYNQSQLFAEGLSEALGKPVVSGNLVRKKQTTTQTKKHRMERWSNVGSAFSVEEPEAFYGKHILLVDDVLTTGATLEACGQALLQSSEDAKLSIATIAYANK